MAHVAEESTKSKSTQTNFRHIQLLGPKVRWGDGLVAHLSLNNGAFLWVRHSTHIGLNGAAGYRGIGIAGGRRNLQANLLRDVFTLGLRDWDADLFLLLSALQLAHSLWSQAAVSPHYWEAILKRLRCALLPGMGWWNWLNVSLSVVLFWIDLASVCF